MTTSTAAEGSTLCQDYEGQSASLVANVTECQVGNAVVVVRRSKNTDHRVLEPHSGVDASRGCMMGGRRTTNRHDEGGKERAGAEAAVDKGCFGEERRGFSYFKSSWSSSAVIIYELQLYGELQFDSETTQISPPPIHLGFRLHFDYCDIRCLIDIIFKLPRGVGTRDPGENPSWRRRKANTSFRAGG